MCYLWFLFRLIANILVLFSNKMAKDVVLNDWADAAPSDLPQAPNANTPSSSSSLSPSALEAQIGLPGLTDGARLAKQARHILRALIRMYIFNCSTSLFTNILFQSNVVAN